MPKRPIFAIGIILSYFWVLPLINGQTSLEKECLDVFDRVVQLVSGKFYDPTFNGTDWMDITQQYRTKAAEAKSRKDCHDLINEMLGTLNTSHTELVDSDEPWFYILKSIFKRASRYENRVLYPQVGIFTEKRGKLHFVRSILEGSSAEKAGIRRGDAIISIDGEPYTPIKSLEGKEGQPVTFEIQRDKEQSALMKLTLTPELKDAQDAFAEACLKSTRVIVSDGHKLGYIHIWGGLIEDIPRAFETGLTQLVEEGCEGLLLDLRDGIGGHAVRYFDILQRSVDRYPEVIQLTRDGKKIYQIIGWDKPLVVLINEGTRSGKEVFAYMVKRSQRGVLVGTKTKGALTGGSGFDMPDGSFLLLAVGYTLIDGKNLEGIGVEPDIEVHSPLEYSAGKDPQLDKGIEVLKKRRGNHLDFKK